MNTTENIQDKFLGQFKSEETKVIVFSKWIPNERYDC